MEALEKPEQTEKGNADVIFVLLLLQGAIGIVTGLGLLLFTAGNPLAILSGFARPAVLFILAAGVVRSAHRVGRRWTIKATVIVEALSLASFLVSAVIGLLGEVDFTINLVTLITNVALPVAVILLLSNDRPRPQLAPPATGDMEGVV
ncbi:MAG TPA: hypothetical protein VFM39_00145 [bacterium]|nr:hypothetical protein [bacterium]